MVPAPPECERQRYNCGAGMCLPFPEYMEAVASRVDMYLLSRTRQ